jgi:hypothetical protein
VEALLKSMSLTYATATSSQLNAMSVSALRTYKLLLIPGGNSITIGRYLSTNTTANIHVPITSPNGSKLDQYWEQGPQLTGWGSTVAKYPDGTPAVVEGKFGSGWVILTGIHAEAPAGWRYGMTFTTSVAADNAYAKTLVAAALNGTWLPHF